MAGEHYMAVDLSTPQLVVEQGARVMESVEANLAKLRTKIGALVPVIEAGHSLKMCGKLTAGRLTGEALAIAGLIAEAEARTYRLHMECTAIADMNGVELPEPKGGGDRS